MILSRVQKMIRDAMRSIAVEAPISRKTGVEKLEGRVE